MDTNKSAQKLGNPAFSYIFPDLLFPSIGRNSGMFMYLYVFAVFFFFLCRLVPPDNCCVANFRGSPQIGAAEGVGEGQCSSGVIRRALDLVKVYVLNRRTMLFRKRLKLIKNADEAVWHNVVDSRKPDGTCPLQSSRHELYCDTPAAWQGADRAKITSTQASLSSSLNISTPRQEALRAPLRPTPRSLLLPVRR